MSSPCKGGVVLLSAAPDAPMWWLSEWTPARFVDSSYPHDCGRTLSDILSRKPRHHQGWQVSSRYANSHAPTVAIA